MSKAHVRFAKTSVVLVVQIFLLFCINVEISAPSLLSWDGPALHALRTELARHSYTASLSHETSAALHHLLVEVADIHARLSTQGPQTVTSKSVRLHSNSTPNHFVSLVPYAFPCNEIPTNCRGYDHRPVNRSNCDISTGLPWHICDGHLNQVARDSMTDRPRLEQMMHDVMRLSLCAYIFRDESSAAAASKLLRAWFVDPQTLMLPSLQFAQGIPGVIDGKPSGCIDLSFVGRGFADAIRLLTYTPEARPHWKPSDHRRLISWCNEMAHEMIFDDVVSRESAMRNNHGLFYDLTVLSLALLDENNYLTNNVSRMLSPQCTGWNWCVRGRLEDQIDEDGVQTHEIHREGYGHYVLYALLAHAHLFLLSTRAGAKMGVRTSPLVKAALWTVRNFDSIVKEGVEPWLIYGAQALRIVSRLTDDVKYEVASCEVLYLMVEDGPRGEREIWSKQRVGMDVWNLVFPALHDAEACGAWVTSQPLTAIDLKVLDQRRQAQEVRTVFVAPFRQKLRLASVLNSMILVIALLISARFWFSRRRRKRK